MTGSDPHVDRTVEFERISLDETSWVDVARGWVAGADEVGDHLLRDVPWRASSVFRYDHRVEQRRLASGWSRGRGRPVPHPVLAEATRILQHRYSVTFDGFTMMQYRDTDMRWLDDTLIAILTFGTQRPWLLTPVGAPRHDDGFDGREPARVVDISPASGDLLVLGGRCQADWMHSVAYQVGRPLQPRISIQWRHARKVGRPYVGAGYGAPRTFGERPNRAR